MSDASFSYFCIFELFILKREPENILLLIFIEKNLGTFLQLKIRFMVASGCYRTRPWNTWK